MTIARINSSKPVSIFAARKMSLMDARVYWTPYASEKKLHEEKLKDEEQRFKRLKNWQTSFRGVGRVCDAWNLTEHELEDEACTAQAILEKNEKVVGLLGQTMPITSAYLDLGTFASEIKPYLDSTQTVEDITSWPLIRGLRLQVKAGILKHGHVLLDLPGLSDLLESRSDIAEKYYQQLSVSVIVTPAIRAVDEKTGMTLMSNHQELCMQLDNKYDKDSFCVSVSKMDELNCDSFYKEPRQAQQDCELRKTLEEIQSLTAAGEAMKKGPRCA